MNDKTIYSMMIKCLTWETGWYKFECQLIVVGLKFSSDAEEEKQVLQEIVIFVC